MLKPKETHLIITIILSIIILTTLLVLTISKILIIDSKELTTTLLTTDGIFIGFIISALGIYYSIPLREEIKVALIKQGYYKQVSRNFIICVIEFSISLFLSIIIMCFSNSSIFINILASLEISIFIGAMFLLILTSINFFKIVTKN